MAKENPPREVYKVTVEGPELSKQQKAELVKRLKCALVLALPERTSSRQIVLQPKVNDRLKA